MLLSTETKLPTCLKPFTFSRTFRIKLIFLVLRIFSCISLVLVGSILRPTVSAVLPTMSAFLVSSWMSEKRSMSSAKSVSSSRAINPY